VRRQPERRLRADVRRARAGHGQQLHARGRLRQPREPQVPRPVDLRGLPRASRSWPRARCRTRTFAQSPRPSSTCTRTRPGARS
jgi:hypothetical protein